MSTSTATANDSRTTARGSDTPWVIVAGREISVKLRDRNFIISTLVTLGLMIGSFALSIFLATKTDTNTVAYSDTDAVALIEIANAQPASPVGKVELSGLDVADNDAVTEAVRSGDADSGLLRRDGQWVLVGKDSVDETVHSTLGDAVATTVMEANAQAAGTEMAAIAAGAQLQSQTLESGDNDSVATIAAMVFGFLFYLAAVLFGYSIASSVVEEKQSRIVEILAAAIPLRQLLVGKIVAATVLGLGQLVLFSGIGLLGLSFTDYSSMVPKVGTAAIWYLVFFVCGFAALAALFAVAGAIATRAEDVQSTASPFLIVVMIAAFGGVFLDGTARLIASYVPIISTVAMPVRLVHGQAQWWEPMVSLVITLIATVAILLVAERIYRRSLLQTGRTLSYREALTLSE